MSEILRIALRLPHWFVQQVMGLVAFIVLAVALGVWSTLLAVYVVIWEAVTGLSFIDYKPWRWGNFKGKSRAERFEITGRKPWCGW